MKGNFRWFLHIIKVSIRQRIGRVFVASLAIAVSSSILVSSLGLSLGIREKLGKELKAYGANFIITRPGDYIKESELTPLGSMKEIDEYTPQLYVPASVSGVGVEIIGVDFSKKYGWKIKGSIPKEGEILIGSDLKGALKTDIGGTLEITSLGRIGSFKVSGFAESGGPEDRSIILNLRDAQRLSALEGLISAVLVRARTDSLEKISSSIPAIEVKTIRQVAHAEESFLEKIELLMLFVTIVVVVASGISVSSTFSATALERLKETALMKALGGSTSQIRNFYLAESALIGLIGGTLGYIIGAISAQVVSKGAFGSFIRVPLYLILISLVMGLFIAIFAGLIPIRGALREKPSIVLRGE